MPIELRIVSGARAGQTETFDKPVIAIGRHPMSDLRFDVKQDLDVSTKHGEIRFSDGRYTLYDNQSTNGTFVNGAKVPSGGSRLLKSGDTVTFGAQGPAMRVSIAGQAPPNTSTASSGAGVAPAAGAAPGSAGPRRPTTERVAIAVKEQTRTMRNVVIGVVSVAALITAGALWVGHSESKKAEEQIQIAQAQTAHVVEQLKKQLHGDTEVVHAAQRRIDSLVGLLKSARGATAKQSATLALTNEQALQHKIGETNFASIRDANDPAVVLLNVEFSGKTERQEATGFSLNTSGLIVTNRHAVEEDGARASKIHVKFANSRDWQAAHLVKMADNPKVDLALIQLDQPGHTPAVVAVAPTMDAAVGSAISTLGFPGGTSLPQDGDGNNLAAKTSLTVGTISKSIADTLQLDSFATHGSSGSPVFDAKGRVIGVIWGGRSDTNGRVVYAVPSDRVVELLKSAK